MFGVPKYWDRIQLNNYLNRMKYMVNDKVFKQTQGNSTWKLTVANNTSYEV